MRKRAVYTILCILFLIAFGRLDISYAADTVKVSAAYDAIYKVNDSTYIVPVYIIDNTGIMGFRIDIGYDASSICIDTISKGKVTSDGNFNTNIATAENGGNVSIWWNNTDDVSEDGTIMYITATVLDASVNTLKLDVSYSQEDTFNSEWKDVEFDCYSIAYPIRDIGEDTTSKSDTESNENVVSGENTTASKDEESSEVVNVREDVASENISEQETTDAWQDERTEDVTNTSLTDGVYKDYDERIVPDSIVSDEREKAFLDTAIKATGSVVEAAKLGDDKVRRALARKMKEYGIKDPHDIPEKQQYEFWNAVADDLISIEGVDEKDISDVDLVKMAENIIVTDEDIENADLSAPSITKKKEKNHFYIWFEAAAIVLVFGGIFIIRRRRK